MKCPYCGKEILSTSGMWIEECKQLLPLLKDLQEFTPKQVMELAKSNGIARDQFQAFRIWEKLKRTGWLNGVKPMNRWKTWSVKNAV